MHLENDMGNCQVFDQFNMISSWCCKSIEFEVEMLVYSLRSSANNLAVMVSSSESTMSFMKIVKRRGPRTLPCTTPLVTEHMLE